MSYTMGLSTIDNDFKSIDILATKDGVAATADELASTAPPSPTNTTVSLSSHDIGMLLESSDEGSEESEVSDDEGWHEVSKRLAGKTFFADAEDDSDDEVIKMENCFSVVLADCHGRSCSQLPSPESTGDASRSDAMVDGLHPWQAVSKRVANKLMSVVIESSGEGLEEPEEAENDEHWRELGRRLAGKKLFADADDESDDDWMPCSFGTLFVSCMSYSMALSAVDCETSSTDICPTKDGLAAEADELTSTAPPSPTASTTSLSSHDFGMLLESSDEGPEEPEDSDSDEDWRALGKRLATKRIFADAEDDSDYDWM